MYARNFVNRDPNAAMNITRRVVLDTSPAELRHSSLVRKPLKVELCKKK
jgi:hypothetical protein